MSSKLHIIDSKHIHSLYLHLIFFTINELHSQNLKSTCCKYNLSIQFVCVIGNYEFINFKGHSAMVMVYSETLHIVNNSELLLLISSY